MSQALGFEFEFSWIEMRLKLKLLPFIYKHHSYISFQFVHGLAGAHYSIETIAKMKEYLLCVDNTAIHLNVPQARPKDYGLF